MIKRQKLLSMVFLLAFAVLVVRLFYWQVIKAKELSEQARRQYQVGAQIQAPRGNILASDETWLAGKVEGWVLYASVPDIKEDGKVIGDKIAPFIVEDVDDKKVLLEEIDRIGALVEKDEAVWVPIKSRVDNDTKKEIETLGIEGIGFDPQELRAYPESSSAAHLLGFVGKNDDGQDQGYFGLEGYYDLMLSGKPGFISRESDAKGIPILLGDNKEVSAIDGVDLVTHIDKSIQVLVEKRLSEGIEKYGAASGSIIVMEPKTGAVLAMSSWPTYEPDIYYKFINDDFRNPVISESFEPGSVFKIVIMASALDADVIEPDTKCDICGGPYNIDKYSIETWDGEYRPDSSMTDVIVHSDNVGMVFVSGKLGKEKMYEYLDKFGIGKNTEIDLQGEMTPALREKDEWSIVDLATASFGQGIALTPIQMIRAASVIANDGHLVTPQVVGVLKGDGWKEEIEPVVKERIISEKAANDITAMMVEAAKNGEAKWTHVGGFKVAGKTGTAQIPIAGHYDEEKTIASFVGFAPYDDPKFIMLVTLKEPSSSPWASETAAPMWYNIAKDLFIYYGVQPESR